MNWKPIGLEMKNEYPPYDGDICMLKFPTVFLYKDNFKREYAIYKDVFVLKGEFSDGQKFFSFPNGEKSENLEECAKAIFEEYGKETYFAPLEEECATRLEKAFPDGKSELKENMCEYIYSAENLRDLPGKKYHNKRNHVAKFDKLYDGNYEYISINEKNLPILEEAVKVLYEKDERDFSEEKKPVQNSLENFAALGISAGVLKVGNDYAAYAIGSGKDSRMCDVHFEKADRSYEGSYAKLNILFSSNDTGNCEYINREEDLGLEGLRKAKQSYYPVCQSKVFAFSFDT